MSDITSHYVYKVVGEASAGVDTRDLVEGLGLPPDGPIDPAHMVSADAYYDFFERLVARDPDGVALPLRIGTTMRSDEYGAFGDARRFRILAVIDDFTCECLALITDTQSPGSGSRANLMRSSGSTANRPPSSASEIGMGPERTALS